MEAAASTREALSGYRAAEAWPEAPRPVSSHDLLPERALAGDGHARRALARELYDPLRDAGGGLLETLVTFLDSRLVGGGRRARPLRPRQHRALPVASDPRGQRLQPDRPARRVRAPAGAHARAGC